MPTALTKWLKPKFTLVTSSAAIATITRPEGRTRHLKMGNIHQVFKKVIWQKLAIITTEVKTKIGLLQQCIKFNVKNRGLEFTRYSVVT